MQIFPKSIEIDENERGQTVLIGINLRQIGAVVSFLRRSVVL